MKKKLQQTPMKEMMRMKLNKTLLIDGSYLLHRSLKVPDIYEMENSKGEKTGGIFQFIRSLQFEIKKHGAYFPIVCMDAGLSERRVELYDNYKKRLDRKERPPISELSGEENKEREEEKEYLEEYRRQRAEVMDFLEYVGIPSIREKGWEGDDLLYIISRDCKESIIVTDDRDLLQLLDENVYVSRPIADEFWTLEEFLEEYDYDDIQEFVIKKAIEGDKSDNIPQVAKGVGEVNAKRIAKLIYNSDSEEEYLKELSKSDSILDERFVDNHKAFKRNLKLIDLSYVDISDYILDAVESEIDYTAGNIDYFKALSFLDEKEITNINLDAIISNLNRLVKENDLN